MWERASICLHAIFLVLDSESLPRRCLDNQSVEREALSCASHSGKLVEGDCQFVKRNCARQRPGADW